MSQTAPHPSDPPPDALIHSPAQTQPAPTPPSPTAEAGEPPEVDPALVHMTLGQHLEDLRRRVIRALIGLAVGALLALCFGSHILELLVRPLAVALDQAGHLILLQQLSPAESMMVYLRTCIMVGLLISAPYGLWQLWQFVAGGLYPHERKYIRVMTPASIGLFAAGVAFFFFIALPVTLTFLIQFAVVIPQPNVASQTWFEQALYGQRTPRVQLRTDPPSATGPAPQTTTQPSPQNVVTIPLKEQPPEQANPGDFWFEPDNRMLKIVGPDGSVFSITLGRRDHPQMVEPNFRLSEYLEFVTLLALSFGLMFQLPLAVLALVLTGLVSVQAFRKARRFVILGLFAIAAILTPTTDPWSMLLMALPAWGLFEAGLIIAARLRPQPPNGSDPAPTATVQAATP